jgi:hypothetical protein
VAVKSHKKKCLDKRKAPVSVEQLQADLKITLPGVKQKRVSKQEAKTSAAMAISQS